MMNHNPIPSSCSCNLPLGQWGQGGWHWYRPTYERLLDCKSMETGVTDLKILEEHYGAIAQAAAGQAWALGPCPCYRDTVTQGVAKKKREARRGDEREIV